MGSDVFQHDFGSNGLALRLKVKLSADQTAVDPVVQRIMELVRKTECATDEKEDAIELALTEALVNAIVHGAKCDPSKSVECDVVCDEKRGMVIVVRDPGCGFNPKSIPSPVTGQNIYSSHGRGIFLINQLMDKVRFHKNGTEIHMVKRLKPVRRPKSQQASKSRPKARTKPARRRTK